jgi:hypothetical protein
MGLACVGGTVGWRIGSEQVAKRKDSIALFEVIKNQRNEVNLNVPQWMGAKDSAGAGEPPPLPPTAPVVQPTVQSAAPAPQPQPAQQSSIPAAVSQEIDAKLAEGQRLAAPAPAQDKPAMPNPTERPPSAPGVAGGTGVALNSATAADRVERFKSLIPLAGIELAKLTAAMGKYGAARFTELSEQHQEALLAAMQKAADARAQAKN